MTGVREDLPLPPHFEPQRVGEVWRVPYEERAREAAAWRDRYRIEASATDRFRIGLLLVDVQNTFCIPGFELFVAGHSGTAAVDDNRRLCSFLYRNLHRVTTILPTLDTHRPIQIFHAMFLVDRDGNPPPPYTLVTAAEVASGRWRVNEAVASSLGSSVDDLMQHLMHYTSSLEQKGRYDLTIWPYHAMLGGIGHALVSAVEEAVFFHSVARSSQPLFQIKGDRPLTESYSVLGPEITQDARGRAIGSRNEGLVSELLAFDAVIVAGQAKSHCVSWTVADLLAAMQASEPSAAHRVYLLEDCTSPVVVPGAIDYTEDANRAFLRFEEAGMHRVRSDSPILEWPGSIAQGI